MDRESKCERCQSGFAAVARRSLTSLLVRSLADQSNDVASSLPLQIMLYFNALYSLIHFPMNIAVIIYKVGGQG